MAAILLIVVNVLTQPAAKMLLTQNDHIVQQILPDGELWVPKMYMDSFRKNYLEPEECGG